jgi:ADP-heptose:LPS heptosyltransferase
MIPQENILLIRLKSIGDILFTLPAVHAVRENFPNARLHFLVSKEHASLLRGFSEIDAVIPVDRRTYGSGNVPAACRDTFQLLRALRQPKFSRTIDFQGYGETAFLSWWTGAPERWGIVYQPARGWAYTRSVPRVGFAHPAEGSLALLLECGLHIGPVRNEYVLPGDVLEEAWRFFAANRLDVAKPTLFLQPFTSTPKKNWPLENFLKLAWHWHSQGVQVIFGGGPGDRAALESARAAGFPISAGVPLLVTGGLMKLSTLIVGGDTGLLHLAVAMGRRVIMLMRSDRRDNMCGPTFPFRRLDWAVIAPASQPVSRVEISRVIEATTHALGAQPS